MRTTIIVIGFLAAATLGIFAAHAQTIETETCRFGPSGYTCRDYLTGPVESVTKIAPLHEIDPAQQLREWEENCRTTIYFDQRNFAHAAEVARRCGMQIQ